jgi:hypothetical protein
MQDLERHTSAITSRLEQLEVRMSQVLKLSHDAKTIQIQKYTILQGSVADDKVALENAKLECNEVNLTVTRLKSDIDAQSLKMAGLETNLAEQRVLNSKHFITIQEYELGEERQSVEQKELEQRCLDFEENIQRILNRKNHDDALWAHQREYHNKHSKRLESEIHHNTTTINELKELRDSNTQKLLDVSTEMEHMHAVLTELNVTAVQLASEHVDPVNTGNADELEELREKVKELDRQVTQGDQDYMRVIKGQQKDKEKYETLLIRNREEDKEKYDTMVEDVNKKLDTASREIHDLHVILNNIREK